MELRSTLSRCASKGFFVLSKIAAVQAREFICMLDTQMLERSSCLDSML